MALEFIRKDSEILFEVYREEKNLSPINSIKKTLSKILCKWKQDSVISSFLYLDSVFKNNHKLVHNQSPV